MLVVFAIVALSSCPDSAHGENSAPRPRLDVPKAAATPRVDASVDDPAWKSAGVIASLELSLQKEAPKHAAVPTEVRLLWDADWLYVRFSCTGGDVHSPFTHHGDPLYQADVVEVFLDPQGDGRQWYEVEVSPHNVTMEVMAMLTAEPKWDADLLLTRRIIDRDFWPNLNYKLPGLRTSASIQREGDAITGWTVDIALPASVILHRAGESKLSPTTMRANFMRYEYPKPAVADGKRELVAMNWGPVLWGQPHISPAAMGHLSLKDVH